MKLRTLITSLITLNSLALLSSCSNTPYEEPTTDEATTQWHSCTLNFDGDMPSFDAGSRAEAGTWAANSQVYIHFKLAGGETTYGNAVLGSDGKWTLNYNGRLSTGATYDCQVFYLDGNVTKDALLSTFTFDSTVGVYADTDAKYTVNGNNVTLSARLVPMTSRIRFVHNENLSNSQFDLSGIEYINRLNVRTLEIARTKASESQPITRYYGTAYNDGYIYGTFPEDSQLLLGIGDYKYTYELPENPSGFMAIGQSGYMNIPTPSAHNGWIIEEETFGQIGTYTSSTSGTGSYRLDFSLTSNQKLRVVLSNIESYTSSIYVYIYNTSGTRLRTISRTTNSTSTLDEYVDLGAGDYYLSVTTSSRRCTFTFYKVRK